MPKIIIAVAIARILVEISSQLPDRANISLDICALFIDNIFIYHTVLTAMYKNFRF